MQADSIVPDPSLAISYDRYAYCRNNPVNLTDPTGHFSEEAIIKFFEVKTWDDVLAIFSKGGKLENRWGVLEILRQGEQGDQISTAANFDDLFGGESEYSQGAFFARLADGSIGIMANDSDKYGFAPLDQQEVVSFFKTPMKAGAYGIKGQRWYGDKRFSTKWWKKGENLVFRPGSVDWTGAGLDTVSVGASLVGANSASNIGKVAVKVGAGASAFSTAKSSMIDRNPNSTLLSIGGFIPGPVGGGFSLASLCINLANGVYFGP